MFDYFDFYFSEFLNPFLKKFDFLDTSVDSQVLNKAIIVVMVIVANESSHGDTCRWK